MSEGYCSLQILLPPEADRQLRRWAQEMPGASWPGWGGHITLVSAFTWPAQHDLAATITGVLQHHRAFSLRLDQLVAEQDLTRADYRAVMLAPRIGGGYRRLAALQADLAAAILTVGSDLRPEITARHFAPHVTLALGVAETEADRIVSQARGANLAVEFWIDTLWLLQFPPAEGMETAIKRTSFAIPGSSNLLSD